MIAGGAGGGALLLAAVAFFMYRRRSKRQVALAPAVLPHFSNRKPAHATAPVLTPAPLFLTPAVRSRPTSQFGLNVGPQLWEYGYVAVCARLA